MHKAWWLGGAGVLVVAAALGAAKVSGVGFGAKEAAKPETTLEFSTREVVQPVVAGMPLRLEFSGALVAPQSAVVRAKASGTLLKLAVAEGSRVRAGQVLGQIDLADIGSRVAERQATVESARAQFAQVGQQLDYTVLRAPYAGIITRRYVEVGQAVQSGPPTTTRLHAGSGCTGASEWLIHS